MIELETHIFYSHACEKYYFVLFPQRWQDGDHMVISPTTFDSEEEALTAAELYLTYKNAQWN